MKKRILFSLSFLINLNAFADCRAPAAKIHEKEPLNVKISPKNLIFIKIKNNTNSFIKVYKNYHNSDFFSDFCKSPKEINEVKLIPNEIYVLGSCSFKTEYITPKNKIIETKDSMVKTSIAIYQDDRGTTWSNYWFSKPNEETIKFWSYSTLANFKYIDFNKFLFSPKVTDSFNNNGDICINVTGSYNDLKSEYVDCDSMIK
jgi:hypothetical protein